MINQLANLNWIGVAVASVMYFIIGGLWFTVFFSKPYKVSLGKANETLPNKPIFVVGPMLCTIVITIASAVLIYALNINSYGGAIEFALLVGIGYLVANTVNIAINPNIPRPILYGIISGSYHLICINLASVIIVALK